MGQISIAKLILRLRRALHQLVNICARNRNWQQTDGGQNGIPSPDMNKQDKLLAPMVVKDFRADASLAVSAKTGQGLEDLKNLLSSWMMEGKIYIERLYPYDKAGTISLIRGYGILLEEEYLPEGIRVKAYVPKDIYPRV